MEGEGSGGIACLCSSLQHRSDFVSREVIDVQEVMALCRRGDPFAAVCALFCSDDGADTPSPRLPPHQSDPLRICWELQWRRCSERMG